MSQKKEIYKHLKRGRMLTPLQALEKFECFRLAARIAELRNEGYDIRTSTVHRGNKSFASYQLRKP